MSGNAWELVRQALQRQESRDTMIETEGRSFRRGSAALAALTTGSRMFACQQSKLVAFHTHFFESGV